MDYREYDRIQAMLGGVGDTLRQEMQSILQESVADDATKALVKDACGQIAMRIDELALLLSQAMRAIESK